MTISRSQANRAGKILKTGKISDEYYDAISILDAWRKQHENPAKSFSKNFLRLQINTQTQLQPIVLNVKSQYLIN